MRLFVSSVTTAGAFDVVLITSAWNEASVTYSARPSFGPVAVPGIQVPLAANGGYLEVDVTAPVVLWIEGPTSNGVANYGLALVPSAGSNLSVSFDSKESQTTSHAAELEIDYVDSSVTGGLNNLQTQLNQEIQNRQSSDVSTLDQANNYTNSQLTVAETFATAAATTAQNNASAYANNTFLPLTGGTLTGSLNLAPGASFNIGSNLFAFGSYANNNAFLGFAGNTAMTGVGNTGTGVQALVSNTTGKLNTAVGNGALFVNTEGGWNTAVGNGALASNTTGDINTASGASALNHNTTGAGNTASGYQALVSNTTGVGNAATGLNALFFNTAGNENTAVGDRALYNNTTGYNNTALGSYAGPDQGSGNLTNATAIGANAQVTQSNSLVLGSIAGVNNATASTNVGIGTTAPQYTLDVHGSGNFTGPVTFASNQTVNGNLSATGLVTGTAFNIGSDLFAFGSYAGQNAFLGFAGNSAMTGTNNTASGSGALSANTMGWGNTASGSGALQANTTAIANTASGYQALFSTTTGKGNTASGYQALFFNTTGTENTALGDGAGRDGTSTNAIGTTAIGAFATISGNLNNATAIGTQAQVTQDNSLVLGSINGVNGATADTKVGIGTTAPGKTLDVAGDIRSTGTVTAAHLVGDGSWLTNIPTGPAGPANTLSIGNVTTGAAGSSAAATITGTSPNQTLNLTIPQGAMGPAGPAGFVNGVSIVRTGWIQSYFGYFPTSDPNVVVKPCGNEGGIRGDSSAKQVTYAFKFSNNPFNTSPPASVTCSITMRHMAETNFAMLAPVFLEWYDDNFCSQAFSSAGISWQENNSFMVNIRVENSNCPYSGGGNPDQNQCWDSSENWYPWSINYICVQ